MDQEHASPVASNSPQMPHDINQHFAQSGAMRRVNQFKGHCLGCAAGHVSLPMLWFSSLYLLMPMAWSGARAVFDASPANTALVKAIHLPKGAIREHQRQWEGAGLLWKRLVLPGMMGHTRAFSSVSHSALLRQPQY